MMHFSCDICGHKLLDRRFVVKMEVYAAFDPEDATDEDQDRDNLDEIADIIGQMAETGDSDVDQNRPHKFRYDLCEDCRDQFVKDPLALHRPRRMRISDN
jgi:hypothetical protein